MNEQRPTGMNPDILKSKDEYKQHEEATLDWPTKAEFEQKQNEYVQQNVADIAETLKTHRASETEIPIMAELFARAFFVANYVEDVFNTGDLDEATITFHRDNDPDLTAHASADFYLNDRIIEDEDWASIKEERAKDIKVANVEISFNLESFEHMSRTIRTKIAELEKQNYPANEIENTRKKMTDTYTGIIQRIAVEETIHVIDLRRAAKDWGIMKLIVSYHHRDPKVDFESYTKDPLEQRAELVVRSFSENFYPELTSRIDNLQQKTSTELKRTLKE